jgi:hypothetical protein
MDELMKFFHARKTAYRTAVRRFDEAIYTPYTYELSKPHAQNASEVPSIPAAISLPETPVSQLDVPGSGEDRDATSPMDTRIPETKHKLSRFHNQQPEGESDVFLFEYGVIARLPSLLAVLMFFLGVADGCDVGHDRNTREAVFILHVRFT